MLDESCSRNGRREDQRHHSHQFHDDIESRAGGVLQGIAYGITDDCVLVRVAFLSMQLHIVFVSEHLLQASTLDELLRVVPCSAGIRGRHSHGRRAHNRAKEERAQHLCSEDVSDAERGEYDERPWGDHLVERRVRCDRDALVAILSVRIWSSIDAIRSLFFELPPHLFHHCPRSNTDALHGESEKPVRNYSPKDKTHKLECPNHRRIDEALRLSVSSE
mmetsp:Transcript_25942/g.36242  ORF Transcript_25942/g.36242 Transcript_25942/m.36242 type:complete len:219 (+) Transcript_25942:114-770(+)